MTDVTLGIKITADGKIARAEVKGLSDDLNKLDSAGRKSADGIKQSGSAAAQASRSFDTLGISAGKLAGYFSAFALVGYTKALIEVGDRANLLAARLQLVTNGARQFAAVQQQLYQQAQNVGVSIESQAELYTTLARATEGSGRSARELLTITDVIAKSLKIGGKSASEAAGAMLQFGQAAGGSVVRAEEFNSMLDGMPTVVQGVAKALNLTKSELKTMVDQGKITSAQWLDAMVQMRESTDEQAKAIGDTFSQAFQRLSNSVFQATAALDKYLGVSKAAASVANSIAESLDSLAGGDQIATFTKRIADLRAQIDSESNKPFAFMNGEKIGRMRQSLADMETALADLKKQGATVADPLAEGFGKAKYEIADVGKTAQATLAAVLDAAKRYNVPGVFAEAIFRRETGWAGKNFQSLVSPKGAIGTMQLMPATAQSLGVDARDAMQNIDGGVKLLAQLLKKYGDDFKKAAAAYNAGERNVDRYGGTPPFKETRDYVAFIEDFIRKHPGGVDLINARDQKSDIAQAKSELDSLVQTQLAAAKASETIKKSELAVQVAINAEQRKAFEDYTKAQADGMRGDQRVRYLEQAARQEQAIIQQGVALKQRAIDIERQATQAELAGINQRIAAADQLRLTESERVTLQNQQKQAQAELASLDQQYNVVAIQGAGELRDVLSGVADAYTQQAAAAQEAADARQAILDRLQDEISALEGLTAGHRELAAAEKASSDLGKQAQAQYLSQVKAQLDKRDELKKAATEQQKAEKAVSDEVLRMGQYYQAMVGQAQQMAQGLSQAFGETGQAIGQLVVGLAQYQDTMYNIQQRTEALLKANRENGGGADKEMQIRAQAMNQELTAQINNYGNLTQAAQSFFDKGTSGYQAMENATKVFRAVELAMTLANYVQMATAGAAYTVQDIAQTEARTTIKGTEAVVNQASGGDPYSAFPRMAAMVAALAALGVAVAGGFSGGGASRGAVSRGTTSSGNVLGDPTGQSSSLKNALDIVAKNSTTDLAYSAGMLRSLQNIESAMAGVTNSIIRNVRPADVQGLGTRQTISWDPLAIFMKTTKAITDWGIGAFPQMLKDILSAGFQGKTFTDITTTTKLFGMTLASSTKTVLGDMASETEKQFTLVFRSITDTVREASRAFGTSADQFNTLLETFVVKFDTTSLKGLKGDELQDAIQGQFSKIADQIAGALNIKGLEEFQRVGEGMFEVLVRVSENITRANAELDALGIKAIKYSEIQFKQGDTAAEIVRQSIVAFEGLESGLGSFIDQAVGSAEDLIATYQDLLQSRDILKGLGLQWENLNRTMTDAAGGVSAFRDALESFRDNFFSSGAQYATDMVSLAREFGNLGLVLPQSKDEFRALAESIDTSTESGAELFARIIKLSEAFSDAADRAAELERKYKSYTDPFAGFKDQIGQVIDDWKAIMDYKLGAIEAEFANKAAVAKQQVNAPYQGSLDMTGARKSTLQEEIAQNVGYLNQTSAEIGRLQDLINRWQGVPKAQAYVAGWRSQMEALQGQADVLVKDIQSKNTELADLNRKIDDLNRQIAQNNADVDTSQLSDKLDALTAERRQLLREQGDAIVQAFQDIWDQIVGVIDDAQSSIQRQIAELQGPRALARNSLATQRDALGDLRRYQKAGGTDPDKLVSLVTSAQDAIMQRYNDRLAILTKQLDKINRPAIKEINQNARTEIRGVNQQLRIDTRDINKQLRIDTRAVQQDANRRIRAIEAAGDAAVEAYRAQVEAQIEGINSAMDAALQALEDRQQAEQDALSDAQDERMQALQDEQQEATKLLQKRHTEEMSALQKQLSTAESLKQTFQQIAQFAQSLKLGDLSTLSPEDKLREAQAQYESILAKARGGDAEAAGQYTSIAQEFARLAQQYFGNNDQYSAIYKRIQADAEALGGTAVTTDPVEAAIEALQKSQEDELEALQKVQRDESRALQKVFRDESRALSRAQQDQADAVRSSYQKQIDAVQKSASKVEEQMRAQTQRQIDKIENQTQRQIAQLERQAQRQIDKAENAAQRQIASIERQAQRQIDKLNNIDTSPAIQDLKNKTIAQLQGLDGILNSARNMARAQADQQIQYLSSLNLLNGRQLQQLNKIGRALGGGITPVPAFAAGGVMKPGPAIVGEKGIEPIWFDKGGRVLSNAEAKASLSDGDKKIAQEIAALKEQIATLTRAQVAANSRMVPAVESLATETAAMRRDAKIRPSKAI